MGLTNNAQVDEILRELRNKSAGIFTVSELFLVYAGIIDPSKIDQHYIQLLIKLRDKIANRS